MIVGLTGSFGSGKSTVAAIFRRFGAYVLDVDRLYHTLLSPSKKLYKALIRHFGKDIIGKDKTIDRRKLAKIVFSERTKYQLLNRLTFPEIIRAINKKILLHKKEKVIIVDAPLLVESGFYKKMDLLIVVNTNRSRQLQRLARNKKISRKEIEERVRMQGPLKKKLALADFIIDNSSSKTKTKLQVAAIWKQLRRNSYESK